MNEEYERKERGEEMKGEGEGKRKAENKKGEMERIRKEKGKERQKMKEDRRGVMGEKGK